MPAEITRPGTVEAFVKASHDIRVSPEALDTFVLELGKVAQLATDRAVRLAEQESRRTLSKDDVLEGFRTAVPIGDDAPPPEPAAIFRQLDRMPPQQVFEVVRLIQEWLAARPR